MNVIREGERSEHRDEELERRITGLEALLCDAQAEIERLRRERDEARTALQPFAEAIREAVEYRDRRCPEATWATFVDITFRHSSLGFIWRVEYDDFARAAEMASDGNKVEHVICPSCTYAFRAVPISEQDRINDLEVALRPFAIAARKAQETGQGIGAKYCDWEHFARAAEMVPEEAS